MKENFKFKRSNKLAQNILIVDGVSATGKKLMCSYLQTFPRVQKMEVNQIFRHIANLSTFNKIDQQTTSTILNLSLIDEEISASQSKTVKVPQVPLAQLPLLLHPLGRPLILLLQLLQPITF